MVDSRHGDHNPIQTSAVLDLIATQRYILPPLSPPTPRASPGRPSNLEDFTLEVTLQENRPSRQRTKTEDRLIDAVHVLSTEAAALLYLTKLYETDPIARDGFNRAVESLLKLSSRAGKLIVTGIGKSGHIGRKMVATFNSLGVQSVFLHPTEALHGDLGMVGRHDAILFITFSGKTQELLALVQHIDESLPLILLTSHIRPLECDLMKIRPDAILLPAPIHEAETMSFGVSAPTTSTTAAIAVGDALAIAVSKELHRSVSSVFARNHPGGAIGASFSKPTNILDLAVRWDSISDIMKCDDEAVGADLLRAGYESASGWVKLRDSVVSPSRIRRLTALDLGLPLNQIPHILVGRDSMLCVAGNTSLKRARDLVRNMRHTPGEDGQDQYRNDCIIAVVERGEIVGVLEVRDPRLRIFFFHTASEWAGRS